MKKEDIIKEIKERLKLYKTIKPEEFDFSDFVSKGSMSRECGTICCLWGWEPRFTNTIKWEIRNDIIVTSKFPENVLGWGEDIIHILYYTSSQNNLHEGSSLEEVLDFWEETIHTLERSSELDHMLDLS